MAIVGFQRTIYSVNEGDGAVEICAVVVEPDIDCPIQFDFDVIFETSDGTAGMYLYMQM